MRYNEFKDSILIKIPSFKLKKLNEYEVRYGLLPERIFELTQEIPPNGLTAEVIAYWLNSPDAKADEYMVEWVLRVCREFVKFILVHPKE